MTRQECESKLIELAEQMDGIYRQYNPDGQGIMVSTYKDGYISVSDIEVDSETKEIVNWTLEAAKNREGEVYALNYDSMTIEVPA